MSKRVIGIVGPIGAGKDTAAQLISEMSGEPVFQVAFSTILREKVLEPEGIPPTRENLQKAGNEIDRDLFRRIVATYIVHQDERIIVLPGVRRQPDADLIRGFPQHRLIAICADIKLCFERARQRPEKPDEAGMTWEDFLKKREAPIESEIPILTQKADIKLENEGTIGELREKLRAELADFLPKLRE